ncbi:circadian clock KaiB family protein [Lyngbya sp. CCY1209]|jgi:circadian clock protein KaiB|uniref:circadian clock KaiB family protein n=1 Tax=Lyngbya sp. CCY1209 TaxID=2886103 RepID=UPI002D20AEC2|nr:circadian clock KaiB family protein [Lyngbya sp. CCY1209]MEB3886747.1 circadian clock KaiB family protein [Lyngbya sp. CCY1209]
MNKYLLKLYITGNTLKSQRAIANLIRICDHELTDQYELKIIDVLEQPELAENEKILVTPTLIKQLPQPIQRIIGDMSNTDKVLLGLDLVPQEEDVDG